MTYRTSMQIVADVLAVTEQTGQEGIKTTSLLTKANLSHSRLEKFVKNLTGAGLMNKIEFDGKHTFVITEKGRQYLESYKKFSNQARTFELDLVVRLARCARERHASLLVCGSHGASPADGGQQQRRLGRRRRRAEWRSSRASVRACGRR